MLEESGAGVNVDAADPSQFLAAARRLRADDAGRVRMAAAGRGYAEAHFDIERIAAQFEAVARVDLAIRSAYAPREMALAPSQEVG